MAKQRKALPARKGREQESLLIRSAESLGRMIGSLQRQLDDATRKQPLAVVHDATPDGFENGRQPTNGNAPALKKATNVDGAGKPRATKVNSAAARHSKRASKSAAARSSAGRRRSGARAKARKATRHA
jgi:hypothetical protein